MSQSAAPPLPPGPDAVDAAIARGIDLDGTPIPAVKT